VENLKAESPDSEDFLERIYLALGSINSLLNRQVEGIKKKDK